MKTIKIIIEYIFNLAKLIFRYGKKTSNGVSYKISEQKLFLKYKIKTNAIISKYRRKVSNAFKERELKHIEQFSKLQIDRINFLANQKKMKPEISQILIKRLENRSKKSDYQFIFSVEERLEIESDDYDTEFIKFLNLKIKNYES